MILNDSIKINEVGNSKELFKIRDEYNRKNTDPNKKAHKQGDYVIIKNVNTGEVIDFISGEVGVKNRTTYSMRRIKDPSELQDGEVLYARKSNGKKGYSYFKDNGKLTKHSINKTTVYNDIDSLIGSK